MCGVEAPSSRGPIKHIRGTHLLGEQFKTALIRHGGVILLRVFIKTYILCKNML